MLDHAMQIPETLTCCLASSGRSFGNAKAYSCQASGTSHVHDTWSGDRSQLTCSKVSSTLLRPSLIQSTAFYLINYQLQLCGFWRQVDSREVEGIATLNAATVDSSCWGLYFPHHVRTYLLLRLISWEKSFYYSKYDEAFEDSKSRIVFKTSEKL